MGRSEEDLKSIQLVVFVINRLLFVMLKTFNTVLFLIFFQFANAESIQQEIESRLDFRLFRTSSYVEESYRTSNLICMTSIFDLRFRLGEIKKMITNP